MLTCFTAQSSSTLTSYFNSMHSLAVRSTVISLWSFTTLYMAEQGKKKKKKPAEGKKNFFNPWLGFFCWGFGGLLGGGGGS